METDKQFKYCQRCGKKFYRGILCQSKWDKKKYCDCQSTTKTHGLSKTRIYKTWCKIKERCFNPNHEHYKYYGGKGVIMCDEWKNDFKVFYDWSIANGYIEGLTIDRIDNSKGYNPENCRWVEFKRQANNKTDNVYLTINGEKKSVADWCRIKNIDPENVYKRIKSGWNQAKLFLQTYETFNKVLSGYRIYIGKQLKHLKINIEEDLKYKVENNKIIIEKENDIMALKKTGGWGGSRSLRLESECKQLGIEMGEEVYVHIVDGKIVIEKMPETFKVKDGVVFNIQE